MKPHHFIALFIFSLCVTSTLCGLKIASPKRVKDLFTKPIVNQVTRFGKIPSGSSLTGTLIVADPVEGCTSFTNGLIRQEQVPIFIVKNGGCKYVIKAMYAQLAGAKMLIIVDKDDEVPKEPVGHDIGFDISIPTIIIGKKDGDKLIQSVTEAAASKTESDKTVIATMNFPYGAPATTVTLHYFFSSADTTDNAYKFIREFKDFYLKSSGVIVFEPHYVTWYCAPCQQQDWKVENPDCVSGGRYCAPDPDSEGPLKGSDVVMEDLRQICVWKNFPEAWWDYVDKFETCITTEKQNQCSQQVLKKLLRDNQVATIDRCMDDSFVGSGKSAKKGLNENDILVTERQMQDDFDISMFPTLFINYQQYMGSLGDSVAVSRAACESLQSPPEFCNKYLSGGTIINNSFDTGTVVTFTFILLIIVIIILFFYRRMARREMTKEMSIQVSQMVSQYFALNDLNESKGKADEL
jgi:hypothetical protein